MRLSLEQMHGIRRIARRLAGEQACGSWLDEGAREGNLDLLNELPNPVANPALVAAQISRLMDGRKVDVVLAAPNLRRLPIQDLASRTGSRYDECPSPVPCASSAGRAR